ncbi:MAG: copper amine oxidase N-terminal domain-containing protein [Caldisericia bacterium]|nr:copper amine oxidase N-terminal domain-containing protein [Caldisericia bacterium]
MRKIYCITLICFFIVSGLSINYAFPTKAIQDISIIVKPRRVSTKASYQIRMKLEKPLEVHDWLKIIWPKDTQLPILPENKSQRNAELKRIVESIYIGTSPCSACQGLPVIDYRENSIRFNTHMELDPANPGYEYVDIHVTDRVGIINPTTPGMYELKIQTAKELDRFASIPYEIVESKIGVPDGIPSVEVTPTGINYKASYNIKFKTGTGGELFMNRSRIRVTFPKGTNLSKSNKEISKSSILVNGKAIGQQPMIFNETVTILAPSYIGNSQEVSVFFSIETGIVNPSSPGEYHVQVNTSEDVDIVDSHSYSITKEIPFLEVIPEIVNRKASYKFSFVADKEITNQYPISIQFPSSMKLPRYIDKKTVFINKSNPISISVRKQLLIINPDQVIENGKLLTIFIKSDAGITNPPTPEAIQLEFKWKDTNQWEVTKAVQIKEPSMKFIKANVDPCNAQANAFFAFTLVNGSIPLEKTDKISIHFPKGTTIPPEIDHQLITVSGRDVTGIVCFETYIDILNPRHIESEENFEIRIQKEAGVINPENGDKNINYGLKTKSLEETIQSPEIYLYPPIPVAKLNLQNGQEGHNGWFTSTPLLSFSTNQKDVEVIFWFDEEEETQLYRKPMALEVGQYITTLHYYAQNSYEKGERVDTEIKIDTIIPELEIIKPIQPTTYTNQDSFLIIGRVLTQGLEPNEENHATDLDRIEINGIPTEYLRDDETKQFTFNLSLDLNDGVNDVSISAFDEAGNKANRTYRIIKDTSPPEIVIEFPTAENPSLEKSFHLKGKTEPFTEVYINGELVFVDAEGLFSYPLRINKIGNTKLFAKAIDKSGNITDQEVSVWVGVTISLKIGSNISVKNDKSTKIDASAFILNGRTMVPFRYIGEALQADISFSTDPMSKLVSQVVFRKGNTKIILSIGKNKAYVNEKAIVLDSPPIIVNGRTMVPVRFVAEQFGCEVNWDSETETVVIRYPVW